MNRSYNRVKAAFMPIVSHPSWTDPQADEIAFRNLWENFHRVYKSFSDDDEFWLLEIHGGASEVEMETFMMLTDWIWDVVTDLVKKGILKPDSENNNHSLTKES